MLLAATVGIPALALGSTQRLAGDFTTIMRCSDPEGKGEVNSNNTKRTKDLMGAEEPCPRHELATKHQGHDETS